MTGWDSYFTPSERHSWGQGRRKERSEIIKELNNSGFADAARYLATGEVPMGVYAHDIRTKTDKLIAAVEALTVAVEKATALRRESLAARSKDKLIEDAVKALQRAVGTTDDGILSNVDVNAIPRDYKII